MGISGRCEEMQSPLSDDDTPEMKSKRSSRNRELDTFIWAALVGMISSESNHLQFESIRECKKIIIIGPLDYRFCKCPEPFRREFVRKNPHPALSAR
jgi:hypothetical protein